MLFDIGFQELTLIGVIALIVVGPERLPKMARTLGLWMGKIRYYVGQVKSDIDREVRAQELKEMLDKPARDLDDLYKVAEETKGTLDEAKDVLGEAKTAFDSASASVSTSNEPAAGSIFPTELTDAGPVQDAPAPAASPSGEVPPVTTEAAASPSGEVPPVTTEAAASPSGEVPPVTTEAAASPSGEVPPVTTEAAASPSGEVPPVTTEAAASPSGEVPPVTTEAAASPSGEALSVTTEADEAVRPESDEVESGPKAVPSAATDADETHERPGERV